MYRDGEGCEVDNDKAMHYFQLAGDDYSQLSLGIPPPLLSMYSNKLLSGKMYRDGVGCEVDYSKAFNYFKTAAEMDNARSQFYLGMCLHSLTHNGLAETYK